MANFSLFNYLCKFAVSVMMNAKVLKFLEKILSPKVKVIRLVLGTVNLVFHFAGAAEPSTPHVKKIGFSTKFYLCRDVK